MHPATSTLRQSKGIRRFMTSPGNVRYLPSIVHTQLQFMAATPACGNNSMSERCRETWPYASLAREIKGFQRYIFADCLTNRQKKQQYDKLQNKSNSGQVHAASARDRCRVRILPVLPPLYGLTRHANWSSKRVDSLFSHQDRFSFRFIQGATNANTWSSGTWSR